MRFVSCVFMHKPTQTHTHAHREASAYRYLNQANGDLNAATEIFFAAQPKGPKIDERGLSSIFDKYAKENKGILVCFCSYVSVVFVCCNRFYSIHCVIVHTESPNTLTEKQLCAYLSAIGVDPEKVCTDVRVGVR